MRGEHRLALPLSEQLEQIGETRNDVGAQLLGRYMQGITRCLLGEFFAARTLLERSMGLADPAYRTIGRGLPYDPYTAMLSWLALTLACLGYIDQARARIDAAMSEVRRLEHFHSLANVLWFANWLDWVTCSPMMHLEEAFALSTMHGFPFYLGWTQAFRGRSLIVTGEASQGLALVKLGLAELRATRSGVHLPVPFTWQAEAYALLEQPTESWNCLAKGGRIVKATDERWAEAELLYRVPGDLLNTAGDQSAAEQHYRQAIAIAERQRAKLFQLRASVSLARLWHDQGKRSEARDLLGPIYNWFTEGFDVPDLKDAKALLNELA
jgi:tetratricopeptide (TPR) repeat protein